MSFLFARFFYWLGHYLTPAVAGFLRGLQVFVLAGVALAHGSNDAQKSMAMVVFALMAFGKASTSQLPAWIAPACGLALGMGVIIGSRRTVQTVGQGFYRVQNLQGLSAQGTTALLVSASSLAGFPMATSHVMSSAVLGAGAAVRPRGIRWNVAGGVGLAWLFTIPGAAVVAMLISYVVSKTL
jgi:PiT family inorganic phosphate transporter